MTFDGATILPQDNKRLATQFEAVKEFMLAHSYGFYSLEQIARLTGYPEASISARLRDLRKPRFGGYTVERRRRSKGQFEYRVYCQTRSYVAEQMSFIASATSDTTISGTTRFEDFTV